MSGESRIPRSIRAGFAGFLAVVLLSLGTDAVLHATGVYPPWLKPMSEGLWVLALSYRIVYGVLGPYITARLAPRRPMPHAMALGAVGLVLSIIGAASHWNKGPEYGPIWFNLSLVVIALPTAWLGGKLYTVSSAK